MNKTNLLRASLAALVAVLGITGASAQTTTWNGGNTGADFNTASNWSNGLPTFSTTATTPTAIFSTTSSANVSANYGPFTGFNFNGGAANATTTIGSTGGFTLVLDPGNTSFSNNAITASNAGIDTISAALVIQNSTTLSNTATSNIAVSGLATGATLNITGPLSIYSNLQFTNTGTTNISGAVTFGTSGQSSGFGNNLNNYGAIIATRGTTVNFSPTSFTQSATGKGGNIQAYSSNNPFPVSTINIGSNVNFLNAQSNFQTATSSGGNGTINLSGQNIGISSIAGTGFVFNPSGAATTSTTWTSTLGSTFAGTASNSYTGTVNLNNSTSAGITSATTLNSNFNTAAGNTLTINGRISQSAGNATVVVNKTGSGTLVLTGSSTYTAANSLQGGTTYLTNTSGSGTGTGTVAVANGASLGGTGTATGAVTTANGGHLIAGIISGSSGLAPTTGGLTLSGGLNTTAGGLVLDVAANGTNAMSTISLGGASNFGTGTTLTLNLYDLGGSTLVANTIYTIFQSTGGGTGTGSGDFAVAGSTPTGWIYDTTYGTNGILFDPTTDALSVRFSAVPEPSTWAMMLGGLLFLGFVMKRRKQTA